MLKDPHSSIFIGRLFCRGMGIYRISFSILILESLNRKHVFLITGRLELNFRLCHLVTKWTWATAFIFLRSDYLTWKMRIIVPILQGCFEDKRIKWQPDEKGLICTSNDFSQAETFCGSGSLILMICSFYFGDNEPGFQQPQAYLLSIWIFYF